MWKKSPLSASSTARPLRIAYVIDPTNCTDDCFDEIIRESYSRWGGRRTPIVPATSDGIDPAYTKWLKFYDADVIYSFVDFTDETVAELHERYAPVYLVRHEIRRFETRRPFAIRLPLEGLSSLSVVSAFASRSWGFEGRPKDIRILNKYWDDSSSPLLADNFGFISSSFSSSAFASSYSDLYSTVTLIGERALNDPRSGRDQHAVYKTDEGEILDELGGRGTLLTLSNLTQFFAPYLDRTHEPQGFDLIIGDSIADRMLFWNGYHRYHALSFHQIAGLRVPVARSHDPELLKRISAIVKRRGIRGVNNQSDYVELRSCTLGVNQLEAIAETLRQIGGWLSVRVTPVEGHKDSVPRFYESPSWRAARFFHDFPTRETTEFADSRAVIPKAVPWHVREKMPPPGLRGGNWMLDLTISRLSDHLNRSHEWVLPRRIRIEGAFEIERYQEETHDYRVDFLRPQFNGTIGMAVNLQTKSIAVTMPNDLDAMHLGLVNYREWYPFDRNRENPPLGRPRFRGARTSDKGRYLLGVLGLFDALSDAFNVLMNRYWRDILMQQGAQPAERNIEVRAQLISAFRKKVNAAGGK